MLKWMMSKVVGNQAQSNVDLAMKLPSHDAENVASAAAAQLNMIFTQESEESRYHYCVLTLESMKKERHGNSHGSPQSIGACLVSDFVTYSMSLRMEKSPTDILHKEAILHNIANFIRRSSRPDVIGVFSQDLKNRTDGINYPSIF